MTAERWQEVQTLYFELAELEAKDRLARLKSISESNPELAERLRRLLAAHDQTDELLDSFDNLISQLEFEALSTIGGELPAPDPHGLVGRTVSHYEVIELLGVGGMGVVYKAIDTRLGRTVALKFLPPQWNLDPNLKRRFEREARAAAALDHPNVCAIYEIAETEEGQLFIAMAYYRGETVKEKIARGPLEVDKAMALAEQAASGLAAAHQAGLVHRDIKPANLMVTEEGTLKILDFGLAKTEDTALTELGTRLGTPAYMSPEQTRGEPVDGGTDYWSLGVVLYEILTGRRPFQADKDSAVIDAIRRAEPRPPSELREGLPAHVDEVVRQLLSKNPEARHGARVVRGVAGVQPIARRPVVVASRTVGVMTAVVVIVAAAIGLFLVRGGGGPGIAPATHHNQLTFSGNVSRTEISPDGELLAYVEKGDPNRLLVKDLTGGTVIEVAAIGRVGSLRWSPDGASLLFAGEDSTDRSVTVTYPRLGGPPRPLSGVAGYVVWAPDGSQVAHWWEGTNDGNNPIRFTTLATDDTGSLETPDSIGSFLYSGDWSPSGRFIALASSVPSPPSYHLWTVAVDGSGWHRLVQDTVWLGGPRWSPSADAVYYLRGDELRKVRVAPDGQVRGAPEVLQAGLDADRDLSNPGLSFTADGRTLVFTKVQSHSNVWQATPNGHGDGAQFTTVQRTHGTASKSRPQISPDGKWIAYVQFEKTEGDVFVVPADGGTPRRVTSGRKAVTDPVWAPDGAVLSFGARKEGKIKVLTVLLDRGQVRTYEGTEMGDGGLAWAPGKRIVYSPPGNRNFHLLDPETGAKEPLVANDSVGWMGYPHYSPDGGRVAVFWNRVDRRGARGTWVVSLEDSSRTLVHPGRAGPVGWTADGGSVYVQEHDSDDILLVPASGGEARVVATVPFGVFDPRGGASADCVPVERSDGLALLCNVGVSVSDAWMVDNFDPAVR